MTAARRTILVATCFLAMGTFACVQDRVTAAGARSYAATQRAALAAGQPGVSIESVMGPAIRRSVRWGAVSAALVLLVGFSVARKGR